MIAFVIPAHNEEALIGACLEAIARCMREVAPERSYEVVVANDASTDRTGDIAREHGATVKDVSLRHIAAVRNAGASAVSPECNWLIFIDADTELTVGALRGAIAALDSGAVGGGARFVSDGRIPWLSRVTFDFFTSLWFSMRLAAGCFVFARRESFAAVGGFDERVYAGEEYFISKALKRRGRFVIVDEPVVTSARKLRSYTPWQMWKFFFLILARGPRGIHRKEGLELWYDAKREGLISSHPRQVVIVATRNRHKVEELQALLGDRDLDLRPLADNAPEVVEDGDTFAANAIKKAESAARFTGHWALADDSGLRVDALDGAPGVHSARFAGGAGDDADQANNRLLLERLAEVADDQRGAAFHCVIALARPDRPTLTYAGEVRGLILREPRGGAGFGYDPLFFYPPLDATFAELAADKKNEVSHRAMALASLRWSSLVGSPSD